MTRDNEVVFGLANVPESESRAYHSDKESIYPLPADTAESDRLTLQHKLIVGLFGGLLQPPVREHLESHEHPAVIDVGCGPGDWIKAGYCLLTKLTAGRQGRVPARRVRRDRLCPDVHRRPPHACEL